MDKKDIISELKKNGYKITNKRQLIIDTILANECFSSKEIYYEASKTDPSIGIATVYRMMAALEEIGILNKESFLKTRKENTERKFNCKVILKNNKQFNIDEKTLKNAVNNSLSRILSININEIDSVLIEIPDTKQIPCKREINYIIKGES